MKVVASFKVSDIFKRTIRTGSLLRQKEETVSFSTAIKLEVFDIIPILHSFSSIPSDSCFRKGSFCGRLASLEHKLVIWPTILEYLV